MAIVPKTDPKGVDAVIDAIQSYLFANLTGAGWTKYECYPRANKNIKGTNIIPEVSKDVKNYIEVLFDDTFNATSFFLVGDNIPFNNEERLITQEVDLIFQVNLKNLFPAVTDHRADEEMHAQILQLLTENEELFVDVEGYSIGVDNVYTGLRLQDYSKDGINLDDISEFHVVRFRFTVVWSADDCAVNFSPICNPATETLNGLPISSIISGGNKDIIIQNDAGPPVQVGAVLLDTPDSLIVSVPAAGAPAGPIAYSRPQNDYTISYNTYDEGYQFINTTDTYVIPVNAKINSVDKSDWYKITLDERAKGHLYRFLGFNDGYYNSDDDTYRLFDGTLSTRQIVFDDDDYAVDRWSGIGYRTIRVGSANLVTHLTNANGATNNGFSDWQIPTLTQQLAITNRTLSAPTSAPDSKVFNITLSAWCCTPYADAPATRGWTFLANKDTVPNKTYTTMDSGNYVRYALN